MIRRIALALGFAILGSLAIGTPAHAAPAAPHFRPAIDEYAGADFQDTCDPTAKPGVVDFRDLLNRTYGTHDSGISRDCSVGDPSEHKEGRALDYSIPANHAQGNDLKTWLLATDKYDNTHAMARRLGIMYIIWNRQIWEAYKEPKAWRDYPCDPNADHDDCHVRHMHFSFSWAGARKQTSWWTGRAVPKGDYNGDGRADLSVFRPDNGTWYVSGQPNVQFGQPDDVPVPGDYNRDGRTDRAVFRPGNGTWYVEGQPNEIFGQFGDIPVPADYNADGRTDKAVFRPSNGTWYIHGMPNQVFGQNGDIPAPADYNRDGRTDKAVFRPSNGTWYIHGMPNQAYGQRGDIPVPGDYNNDGRADIAVFRPSTGVWWISGMPAQVYGQQSDIPVPADYNGDGRTEKAVFRPSNGTWYIHGVGTFTHGTYDDIPGVGQLIFYW